MLYSKQFTLQHLRCLPPDPIPNSKSRDCSLWIGYNLSVLHWADISQCEAMTYIIIIAGRLFETACNNFTEGKSRDKLESQAHR